MKKIILIILFLLIARPQNVFASSLNMTISPSLITVKTSSLDDIVKEIRVKNNSDHNVSYIITMLPFIPSPLGDGEPLLQDSVNKSYNTLFQNIDILDYQAPTNKIDLAPDQEEILKFVLHPTASITPSDYYFSILFTSQDDQSPDGSGAKINQALAVNVLISYGKHTDPSGIIKEFSAPSFVDKGPIDFKVSIANTSQNFITPNGNIEIKNMFGQTVGSIELSSMNVLSRSQRFFDHPAWNEQFLLGVYSAKAQIALSPAGPVLTKEIKFFVFPLQYLAITFASLLFVVYLIYRAVKKRSIN